MKTSMYFVFVICMAISLGFYSCQKDYISELEQDQETPVLKRGGSPTDVEQGDLYGDLIEVERTAGGIPVLYLLNYEVEYQDEVKTGTITVLNPRLDGNFTLFILEKYVLVPSLQSSDPTDDEEPGDGMVEVEIEVDENGFITNYPPAALYDGEGELLAGAAEHVFPVEEGRLNLVRSPRSVIESRMTEVLKNFGNGTVADVVRDFCGRFYMIRTQNALDLGIEDKPVDSPLENLALYWELMNYGFSRSAGENGLRFLVEDDATFGGFVLQTKMDNDWVSDPITFADLLGDVVNERLFVANLAAACIAASSDKSNFLNFDEIAYVNQFMGVPYIPNFDSSKDQMDQVQCFFPVVQQEVVMLDKTTKDSYTKYRYYVDYSDFEYNRTKFSETILDLWTIINYEAVDTGEDLILHEILSGGYSESIFDGYGYTPHSGIQSGAVGFANQADDYVQALQVVHNNEEFLRWQMPTPTWTDASGIVRDIESPFLFEAPEESHGNKPAVTGSGGSGGRR